MQSTIQKTFILLIVVTVMGVGLFSASSAVAQTETKDLQSATSVATNTPIASTSSKKESISHGKIRLNLNIPKKITSSPAYLKDIKLGPGSVINKRYLEAYVRHLALTEPIELISIDDEKVVVEIDGLAKLFGFIPFNTTYRVEIEINTQLEDITVTRPDSWGWLATKKKPDVIVSQIAADIDAAQYISTTQLKAYAVQAAVQAVRED